VLPKSINLESKKLMAIKEVGSDANGNIKLEGVFELLEDLKKYEQVDLKKSLFREMTKIAQPIVKDAQFFLPTQTSTLSGWGGKNTSSGVNVGANERWKPKQSGSWGFPVYHEASAKKGVRAQVGPKGKNRGKNFYTNLLSVIQSNGAAMVFEYAGTKSNNKFAKALESKGFGRPMRSLFKAVDKNLKEVQDGVKDAIIRTEEEFNTRQAKVRGDK
jgi:hypothetical protein